MILETFFFFYDTLFGSVHSVSDFLCPLPSRVSVLPVGKVSRLSPLGPSAFLLLFHLYSGVSSLF